MPLILKIILPTFVVGEVKSAPPKNMHVATKSKDIVRTRYQWAVQGYVVKAECEGEEMWCSQNCEHKAVYFKMIEVEKNKRKADAFLRKVATERAARERAYQLKKDAEWQAKLNAGKIPVVFTLPIDESHVVESNGKSWKIWIGETYKSSAHGGKIVRSYEYLPKSQTQMERVESLNKVVIVIPTWLFEENNWLEQYRAMPDGVHKRRRGYDAEEEETE